MHFFKKIVLISIIFSVNAFAKGTDSKLVITPIVGLENVQKLEPTAMMKTRVIIGARAVYKLPIASAEGELTHAQDSSTSSNTTYKDETDKLKVGLRGTFSMTSFFSSHLSSGAQFRLTTLTKTVGSVNPVTTVTTTRKVNPYLGTGIAIHFFEVFSLVADLAVIYTPTKTPGLKDYELQPSIGCSVSI